MIIVFFNSRGIVHKEFVPSGQTVNHAFYKAILEQLPERVQRVFLAREVVPDKGPIPRVTGGAR